MLKYKMIALSAGVALLAGSAVMAGGHGCSSADQAGHVQTTSLESAVKAAENTGLPVLIKVGAEWCSACKAFDKAVAETSSFKDGIADRAILVQIDGEKGEGVEIAKHYNVHAYPSFLLTNSKGELMDRWIGFDDAETFATSLKSATSDPLTFHARKERFSQHPTAADAVKLAELNGYEGNYAEAAALYTRASSLDSSVNHGFEAFQMVAKGAYYNVFPVEDVMRHADAVLASNHTGDMQAIKVAHTMAKVASRSHDQAHYVPYLSKAMARTENSSDAKVQKARNYLMPDYALHVEKNTDKAVQLKKDAMPEDWMEQANLLNNFAWWCFENEINLHEAEVMARKGVELAESGTTKANVLDTLAEICNLKGDCGDALEIMQLAVAEAPDNEYFRQQLKRFEELVAAKN